MPRVTIYWSSLQRSQIIDKRNPKPKESWQLYQKFYDITRYPSSYRFCMFDRNKKFPKWSQTRFFGGRGGGNTPLEPTAPIVLHCSHKRGLPNEGSPPTSLKSHRYTRNAFNALTLVSCSDVRPTQWVFPQQRRYHRQVRLVYRRGFSGTLEGMDRSSSTSL